MTYEYVCEACGHQWEAEQSIKDAALKTCVSCGASKAKRLVSGGTGFLLKGGGWYADLYSSAGAAKSDAAKADDNKGAKAGATGTKTESSESKPAPAAADSKSSAESKPSQSSATPAATPSASSTSAKAS